MPDPVQALVAEADPAVNQLVAVVLARDGYRVHRVPDPSAVAAALTPDVRLVVAGGAGGGVTAAEAAVGMRARGDHTPVLILTGRASPAAQALAAADPAVRVLPKPFRPADLSAAAALLAGA